MVKYIINKKLKRGKVYSRSRNKNNIKKTKYKNKFKLPKSRKLTKFRNWRRKLNRKLNNKSKKNILTGGATGNTTCAPIIQHINKNKQNKLSKKTKQSVHKDSCMTKTALNKLVSAWNKSIKDKKLYININDSQQQIYENMVKILKKQNKKLLPEHEWWEQEWVKEQLNDKEIQEIKDMHYSPDAPDSWINNPDEWLSTLDIDNKLQQYEDKYVNFKYYGATPIDFALRSSDGSCQINSLCNININQLLNQKNPKKYIGIVFNLDKHYQPGSHWVAMYIIMENGNSKIKPKYEINYWDSYAIDPPKEVNELIDKLKSQGLNMKPEIKFKVNVNKVRHQFGGSECGMYSCHFIIEQLEGGKTFAQVCNNIKKDNQMLELRKKYFNF
jgi:hypothetical protein